MFFLPTLPPVTVGFPPPWWLLADATPGLPPPSLGPWLLNLLYVAGVLFFVLGGIEKFRAVFAKNPPLDDTLRELARKIALCAPQEKLDSLHGQIIPKDQIVTHDELSKAKDEILKAGEDRIGKIRGEVQSTIDPLKHDLAELAKATAARGATLEERTKNQTHQLDSMSLKIDKLLQRPAK